MSKFPHHSPPPYASPTGSTDLPGPPRRGIWIAVLVAIIAGAGSLVCCGGGVFFLNFGFGIIEMETQDQLVATPEFREHVGTIESFEMNWTRSFKEEDDQTYAYDFEGSRGNGYVVVRQRTGQQGQEVIESAEMVMDDGRRIPIEITSAP